MKIAAKVPAGHPENAKNREEKIGLKKIIDTIFVFFVKKCSFGMGSVSVLYFIQCGLLCRLGLPGLFKKYRVINRLLEKDPTGEMVSKLDNRQLEELLAMLSTMPVCNALAAVGCSFVVLFTVIILNIITIHSFAHSLLIFIGGFIAATVNGYFGYMIAGYRISPPMKKVQEAIFHRNIKYKKIHFNSYKQLFYGFNISILVNSLNIFPEERNDSTWRLPDGKQEEGTEGNRGFLFPAEKGITLNCSIAPEIPDLLTGDGSHLRQVIVNLTRNAVKFTDKGEVKVTAKVDGSLTRRFGGTGLEAAKEIRKCKEPEDIPIIALTAHAIKGDKERFLEAGMTVYISKPIDYKEFYVTIERYI